MRPGLLGTPASSLSTATPLLLVMVMMVVMISLPGSATWTHKIRWTWLPTLVAGPGTVTGRASAVRVSEHLRRARHQHRCHHESYRKNQKYALHYFFTSFHPVPDKTGHWNTTANGGGDLPDYTAGGHGRGAHRRTPAQR